MTNRQVGRVNQQSKGEAPLVRGVLQRAAVRAVAQKEEEATQEVELGGLSQSRFVHDFSQVPNDRGGLPKEVSKTPNQTGLPDKLKAGVENLSGYSLDDVRVHYNSPKPAQLQALAYAQGTEIHVAPGQEANLPHEAWHVVQQKQGRVKPTKQAKGVGINDEQGLEKEAEQRSKQATANRGEEKPDKVPSEFIRNGTVSLNETIQRKVKEGGDVTEDNTRWKSIKDKKAAREMIKSSEEYTREEITKFIEQQQKERDQPNMPYVEKLREVIAEAKTVLSREEIETEMMSKMTLNSDEEREVAKKGVSKYLNSPEKYTVATIANAKAQGALGHHIFIEYEDETISEYAWPETKGYYPKSQQEPRETTVSQVARIRMAAKKYGHGGRQGRYYTDAPNMKPEFEGYVYFPWYQDCFHWVDKVLSEAGEAKNTKLERIKEGHVGMWGGVLVLVVGGIYLSQKNG